MPTYDDLNWQDIDFSQEDFHLVTHQDKAQWLKEIDSHSQLFENLGERMPTQLIERQKQLKQDIQSA